MTLKEFREKTKDLPDETILTLYDGEYGDNYDASRVITQAGGEDNWYYGFWGDHPEETEEYEKATKNKIVII